MYIIICEIDDQCKFDAWSRALRASALGQPGGMGWGGRWEGHSGWGHTCPCGWFMSMYGKKKKTPQYCKVIILHLKKKKESAYQCRRHRFDPWVGKIPWGRKWQPTPVFLPWNSQGQRNLVGYGPWVLKESDKTEVTYTHCDAYIRINLYISPSQVYRDVRANVDILSTSSKVV